MRFVVNSMQLAGFGRWRVAPPPETYRFTKSKIKG
jgi:hypothetical protein